MIFRQFFDSVSSTYTYLIASGKGREALIIDPVLEKTDQYIKLLHELDLRLVKVIDTHIHADHISGIAELRDKTKCITIMGEHAPGDVVSMSVKDNESVSIEKIHLKALYTPGHTDDSYSFLMNDRVFTGDTLLIKGTGRTDFQNGDPYDAYNSIFERFNAEVKKEKQNIPELTRIFNQSTLYETRLQILHFLFGVANADGSISQPELSKVEQIAAALGIRPHDLESIKAMFVKATDSAYKILDIPQTATNEEVKKAYRAMAKKYHPDKLQSKDPALVKGQ